MQIHSTCAGEVSLERLTYHCVAKPEFSDKRLGVTGHQESLSYDKHALAEDLNGMDTKGSIFVWVVLGTLVIAAYSSGL